jgi:hypothetical protein
MWVGGSLAVAIVAIGLAVFAEIKRREAQTQRDRAERTLTLATGTANGLVTDLAQKFRNTVGGADRHHQRHPGSGAQAAGPTSGLR